MPEEFKKNITEIAELTNSYALSNENKYIEEIESKFKNYLSADKVRICKYDDEEKSLSSLGENDSAPVILDSSITQLAAIKKEPIIVNHLTSDKYYNAEIDNPSKIKTRAFMIYPIVKDDKTIGVLRFKRGISQRKVFTKKDKALLQLFNSVLIRLIESQVIEKSELIEIVNEMWENNKVNEKREERVSKISKNDKNPTSQKENDELESLKRIYAENITELESCLMQITEHEKLLENKSIEIEKLRSELKKLIKSEEIYKSQSSEGQESLKILEDEYKKMLEKKDVEYLTKIKLLEDDLQTTIDNNIKLKEELRSQSTNIDLLKAEMRSSSQSCYEQLEQNIEFIFQALDEEFKDKEYAFMLFEMIIFALNSNKGMFLIEEKIKESKLLPEIMKDYYFNGDLKINNEKVIIEKMVQLINGLESTVFSKACEIKVKTENTVPASLVFDLPKTYSIIYHLLYDLYQFIDSSNDVDINLNYDQKMLKFSIMGHTNLQNSLIKSIFKQTKAGGAEKDRLGLQLSRKLAERLKGKLEVESKDDLYIYNLFIPVKKIKM